MLYHQEIYRHETYSMTDREALAPLHHLLSQAEVLVEKLSSTVLSADEQDDKWFTFSQDVMAFEKTAAILLDEDFVKKIETNQLNQEARAILDQIEVMHHSLTTVLLSEQNHIASELRQQVHTDKAMDAYRR